MTAIAIVGTSLGFIVAADGRCTLEEAFRPRATPAQLARESEHMQKIFPAKVNGGELAYAFTGTIANDDSGIDLLRESEKQQLLLSKKSFDDARRYINKFSEGLDAAINRYKHFPKLAPRLEGPGWDILNAFFVGYFKRNRAFTGPSSTTCAGLSLNTKSRHMPVRSCPDHKLSDGRCTTMMVPPWLILHLHNT